jgi:hypothetical protein
VYIGQKGRHIPTRISQYIGDTRQDNQQSAVGEHSNETKGNIEFDRTEGTASIRNNCHPLSGKHSKEQNISTTGNLKTDTG